MTSVTVLSLCNFSLCGKTQHLSLNYATGRFCVFVSYMKEMKVNTDEITAKSLNICKPSLAQEGSRFECVSLTSLFLHFFSSFLLHWTNRTNCHWEHMSDIKPSSFSDLGTALIWLLQETSKHIFEPVASDSLCWFKEWTHSFLLLRQKQQKCLFPVCYKVGVLFSFRLSCNSGDSVCFGIRYGNWFRLRRSPHWHEGSENKPETKERMWR